MKALWPLLAILNGGCAPAAFNDPMMYQPQGVGWIGSSYGYKDALIDERTFVLTFTHVEEVQAQAGFYKRARELCTPLNKTGKFEFVTNQPQVSGGGRTTTETVTYRGVTMESSSSLAKARGTIKCE